MLPLFSRRSQRAGQLLSNVLKTVLKLILILGLGVATPAMSCTCADREALFEDQVAEAFARATSVFFGEVESVESFVEKKSMGNGRQISTEGQVVHVKVLKSWKGDKKVGERVLARTITSCCMCGIAVRPHERWLVYSYGDEPISLSQCSRTKKTDLHSPDIPVIERIKRGEPARELPPELPEPAHVD